MAVTSGKISLAVQMKDALAAAATRLVGYDVPIQPAMLSASTSWANGTGANEVNKAYQLSGTTTISTPVDIDLATVVCTDGTTGFSYVRIVIIFNDATNSAHVLTLGGGTNPFKPYLAGTTPTYGIEASGVYFAIKPLGANGWTVDGTNKTLRLDPGAAAIPYRVVVFGS